MIKIREIEQNDAKAFLDACKKIDEETEFMALEPGERKITVEDARKRIGDIISKTNHNIFIAENENGILGYLSAIGGKFNREKHRVYIVIGILQEFTQQGIGTRLFSALEEWALRQDLHRLELTVMVHNENALNLYKKLGYQVEGKRIHSFLINGNYIDEYYMGKLLE